MRTLCSTLFAAALLAAAGCSGESNPVARVDNAIVRLPAAPGAPGAGYFSAELSSSTDAIVAITSPSAERIEMHETVTQDGRSRMIPVNRAGRDAAGAIRFEAGGMHLMLFGLDPSLQPGGTIVLAFRFEQSAPISVRAQLAAPGSMAGH